MKIVGLDHVLLAMPAGEEEKARWFYGKLLGLCEVEKPAPLAARGGCWFSGQATFLHLGVQPDFRPATKAHPALLVSDLEALRNKLEAEGMRVVPDHALAEVRRFYADDPFGNRIEFIQQEDGFSGPSDGTGETTEI